MDRRVVSRILVALLVIGAIVAVGAYEYRLGVARGVAMGGKLPAGAPGAYPYPAWGWGFHPFSFVFPLLFSGLAVLATRAAKKALVVPGEGRDYADSSSLSTRNP